MREPEALRTVPLYTKEQVEQVLRAHGVTEGDVVVTKNPDGQIVAVTRQDDEGRILKIIAQSTDGVREGGKP